MVAIILYCLSVSKYFYDKIKNIKQGEVNYKEAKTSLEENNEQKSVNSLNKYSNSTNNSENKILTESRSENVKLSIVNVSCNIQSKNINLTKGNNSVQTPTLSNEEMNEVHETNKNESISMHLQSEHKYEDDITESDIKNAIDDVEALNMMHTNDYVMMLYDDNNDFNKTKDIDLDLFECKKKVAEHSIDSIEVNVEDKELPEQDFHSDNSNEEISETYAILQNKVKNIEYQISLELNLSPLNNQKMVINDEKNILIEEDDIFLDKKYENQNIDHLCKNSMNFKNIVEKNNIDESEGVCTLSHTNSNSNLILKNKASFDLNHEKDSNLNTTEKIEISKQNEEDELITSSEEIVYVSNDNLKKLIFEETSALSNENKSPISDYRELSIFSYSRTNGKKKLSYKVYMLIEKKSFLVILFTIDFFFKGRILFICFKS